MAPVIIHELARDLVSDIGLFHFEFTQCGASSGEIVGPSDKNWSKLSKFGHTRNASKS
jgi:hypothetical protein